MKTTLFKRIEDVITSLDIDGITDDRKANLKPLTEFIQSKVSNHQEVRINFICTHNSRRSHLSQVWAQTLASHFNIHNVFCYSGGTESTALFPVVAETLKNQVLKSTRFPKVITPFTASNTPKMSPLLSGFQKR